MPNLLSSLCEVLPASAILTTAAARAPYERDWRGLFAAPAVCVVLPADAAEVAAVVRVCATAGVAVVPQGGNTGLVAGGVPVAGRPQLVLSLARMDRILAVDAVGDTITVQAGVTLQAVQDAAAAAGRLFAVSLAAEGTAMIGGVISTNAGGIQVLAYGSMRAQVLGLQVVLADGQVWDGLRVLAKDNTGFDLKQLFIGGEGLLGVVTAAVLRLWPAVAARATALVGVAGVSDAVAVFQALRGRAGGQLTMCEFIGGTAMDLALAHVPGGRRPLAAAAYMLVEIAATDAGAAVGALLEEVLAAALESGAAVDAVVAQSGRERADMLRLREAISDAELAEGGAVKHDIAVPVALLAAAVGQVEAMVAADYPECRLNLFGHIGDGNLHVNIRPPVGQALADLAPRKAGMTAAVEAIALALGGSFSAEHGIGQMRIVGMAAHKAPVELALMRAVKQALDPANIFNPGKVLPP